MSYPNQQPTLPDLFTEGGGYATSDVLNNPRAVIRAICLELGIDPKGADADVAARLARIDGALGGTGGDTYQVKVVDADSTPHYLQGAVSAGDGITLAIVDGKLKVSVTAPAGPGSPPGGVGDLDLLLWASASNSNWPINDSVYGGVDFDTEPTKAAPFYKYSFTDSRQKTVDAFMCNPLMVLNWQALVGRWIRVKVGGWWGYWNYGGTAPMDWGTVGVALQDFGGNVYGRASGVYSTFPLKRADGSAANAPPGPPSPQSDAGWMVQYTQDIKLVEGSMVYGFVPIFAHSANQQNPLMFPSPVSQDVGWFVKGWLLPAS